MVGNNKQTKHKFSVSLKHQMCRVITMITTIMVRVTSFSCSQIVPTNLFLIPNCLHSSSTFYHVFGPCKIWIYVYGKKYDDDHNHNACLCEKKANELWAIFTHKQSKKMNKADLIG